MVIQGCFLFLFGPVLAGWISPNLMEQASIWCFFSIAQMSDTQRHAPARMELAGVAMLLLEL